MAQLSTPVEPFGEVNVYRGNNGGLDVVATIVAEPVGLENARGALALDGSVSMKKLYGGKSSGPFPTELPNIVEPVAREMAKYLTRFTVDAKVELAYWSCGIDGSQIEPIGTLSATECDGTTFRGPATQEWGRQTQLLPVTRYFAEEALRSPGWSIGVIITDGEWNDVEAVQEYSRSLGEAIARGERNDIKLVIIGVCSGQTTPEASQQQLNKIHELCEVLDDMFVGSGLRKPNGDEVDIWDHKIANEMGKLSEIFAEVTSENIVVLPTGGRILDSQGNVAREYASGLPSLLRFSLPANSTGFTLDCSEGQYRQEIGEALSRI